MKPRPRILYLASSWPRGKAFGGQLRALHIGRALKEVGDVSLIVVSNETDNAEARRLSAEEFTVLPPIIPAVTPNRGLSQKLKWAFGSGTMNLHGLTASPADRARVVASFAQFDLIWVLNARTANILHIWDWPHAHLDIDDVPSTYLRSVAETQTSTRRWRTQALQFLSKRRELRFKERFTTLSVCSEADRRYLGGGPQIHVIPNGFSRPPNAPLRAPSSAPPRIGFIGLYSFAPNLDGVRWFLKECWPAIRKAVPGIRFRLAGKDTDGELAPGDPDVDVLGWIDNPEAEIATWSAMVIPIRFGGGTRIKIADAFSRKCPVVSTPMGAFGYEVYNRNQLRLADNPSAFTDACIRLVQDPVEGNAMAERAWNEFLQKWTWEAIGAQVRSAAQECLRRSVSFRE